MEIFRHSTKRPLKVLNLFAMGHFKIWVFILVTGLVSALIKASDPTQMMKELNQHRSGMYVVFKDDLMDGTKDGIVHLFEEITENIGAYALIHYKRNYVVADYAKSMLENAIRSKVENNRAQKVINWKAVLESELKYIEKMVKQYVKIDAKTELSIAIVIVDGKTATQAESTALAGSMSKNKAGSVHKRVVVSDPNTRFVFMGTGFSLDRNQEAMAHGKLEDIQDWNEAAKTIFDCGKVPKDNEQNAKGTIIIDLAYNRKN